MSINIHWDPAWPHQPNHERVVDAEPVMVIPNHHGVFASDRGVALRFMRLYQEKLLYNKEDGSVAGEFVIHDLAIVSLSWEAAKDLHARLGEELARQEASVGVDIARPTGCPYPQVHVFRG